MLQANKSTIQTMESCFGYWQKELAGNLPILELPTDYQSLPNEPKKINTESLLLSSKLTNQLTAFCHQQEVNLFTILLTTFNILIHSYTKQEDIIINYYFGNLEQQINPKNSNFNDINILPLRININNNHSFQELLKQINQSILNAEKYQDIKFREIISELKLDPKNTSVQLSPVCLMYDKSKVNKKAKIHSSNFDLHLHIEELENSNLKLELAYNQNIFASARITEMLQQYEHLLNQIVAKNEIKISELSLLTSTAKAILPNPQQPLPTTKIETVHTLINQQVQRLPEKIAISDSQITWNYRELEERTNFLANYLIAHQIQTQDIVAIYGKRDASLVWAILGILKAGAAFVILDPAYPTSRLIDYLQISQPSAFIKATNEEELPTDISEYLDSLSYRCHLELTLESIEIVRDQFQSYGNNYPTVEVKLDNLAYVSFTSGSTGKPKGILGTHRPLSHFLEWHSQTFELKESDRFSMISGLSHDPLLRDIFTPLTVGATLCIPQQKDIETPGKLAEWMVQQQITVSHLTPAMGQLLTINTDVINNCQRYFFFGGDILTIQDVERINNFAPHATCVNFYGATETPQAMGYFIIPQPEERNLFKDNIPIGTGIADVQLLILTSQQQLAGFSEWGEIYIRTPYLSKGYIGSQEMTLERFIINPFTNNPEDRLYKTGDLGRYLPNGNIEFLGRSDYQVKIRGFRIELGEIEALLNQHPSIQKNVVIARENKLGDKTLVAYCVAAQGQELTTSAIRQFLKTQLPEYMIPSAFVVLDQLPLTPNGKIDRRALPKPEEINQELLANFIAPETELQIKITEIWEEVLHIHPIGINQDFFELGGHSLLATQIVSRIRKNLKIDLNISHLFASPTIESLATWIESNYDLESDLTAAEIHYIARENNIPLAFNQEGLWFLWQLDPDSNAYNLTNSYHLRGELDINALSKSWIKLVERHEPLRTTFRNVNGQPIQIIHQPETIEFPIIDLQHLPTNEREVVIHQLQQKDINEPFDLTVYPLWRIKLIKLSPTENILLITIHHIIFDGWSWNLLFTKISTFYSGFLLNETTKLVDLPIYYADFAHWQRQWLQGENFNNLVQYWQQQLAGIEPVLNLPTDKPRPAEIGFVGDTKSIQLSRDLSEKLKLFSQRQGVTLFMTLLAAFEILLYRYSGQTDIVIGSPIAGRKKEEVERLIGYFVNTIVLRTDLAGNPSFTELLQQVKATTIGAYEHQDLPFDKLVQELNPERSVSYHPIYQVMFAWQNTRGESLQLPELEIAEIPQDLKIAKFDLTLELEETEQGISGFFEYRTDLFEPATINRMIGHFQTLLAAIVANPHTPIANLPLLTPEEQQQLLIGWNNTTVQYPPYSCIHELIEQQVQRTPKAIAVVWENQTLTYQELNNRANQIAHYLRSLGIQPDVRVGICVERCLEMIVGMLAILKAGAAYVPLDPAYPLERLEFMLSDAQVPVILTKSALLQSLPNHQAQVICLDTDESIFSQQSVENPDYQNQPHNLAYMIYTSGSTGKPKGTMIEHRSLINAYLAWEDAYHLSSETSSHLQMASFSFDVCSGDLVRALCSGAKLVLCPKDFLLDPQQLYTLMQQEKIDCAEFVPAVLRNLVQYLEQTKQNLAFMKLLVAGSDSWYLSEYKYIRSLCGDQTRLINSYGVSEATIDTTYFETERVDFEFDRLTPIGRPFANNQVYLLDDYNQPVPIGVPGELYIGGAGLARGYFNRPDLTADKFIPNPFADYFPHNQDQRLYKTNDKARYLADGNIEFLGRLDNQVKIRGFRIELGEIESLINQHPQIKESIVIVREDVPGNKRIVAYIVAQPEQQINYQELSQYLSQQLPNHFIPSAYVSLDSLPLTPNGKLDRKALPVPEYSLKTDDDFVSPRTETEIVLANIWSQILGLERVGINDNFFELGGHSLLIVQVINGIKQELSVEISLRQVFQTPVLAELAQIIDNSDRKNSQISTISPIPPRPNRESGVLSFAQQRLWFLEQLEPGRVDYHIRKAAKLTGVLNVTALEKAMNTIIARHEILRTNYITENGEAIQVIRPYVMVKLAIHDLQDYSPIEQQQEIKRLLQLESDRPFNLSQDLMLRFTLLQISPQEHILQLVMHHIAFDGWSLNILLPELSQLYQVFSQGQPSPLADLPIQYADFAQWQIEYLQGDVLESLVGYWKQQMVGAPALLSLPTDRPRPAVQTSKGASHSFILSPQFTQMLKLFSRQEGVTLFMTLLAAYNTLLSRYTGTEDIVIGVPIANRDRQELEGLIGFFINTVLFRTDVSHHLSFQELLNRVTEVALEAYTHQDLPFETLVEVLQPQRDLSYSPLFQVMLVFEEDVSGQTINLFNLNTSPWIGEDSTSKIDLTLFLEQRQEGLVGKWVYNTDLFNASTIERMSGHFQTLLEAIIANPQQSISELPILTQNEQQQLLKEWNKTEKQYSSKCIHQLFEEQVNLTPDVVAVIFEEQKITYKELNSRANQLANYLRKLGVKPDSLVGICLERSLEMIVGMLGILKAGGAYVPIDPAFPSERISFMLEDAQVSVLLTQSGLTPGLNAQVTKIVDLDVDRVTISQEKSENLENLATPENLAYIIFTSGSTGRSKGVGIEHQQLFNYISGIQERLFTGVTGNYALISTFAADLGNTVLFPSLCYGGCLHIISKERASDPNLFVEYCRKNPIDCLKIVPSHLAALLSCSHPEVILPRQRLILGGEATNWDLIATIQKYAPNCQIFNHYGPTEATVGVLTYSVSSQSSEYNSQIVPLGRPLPNTEIYLLDKYQQPVPVGVPGEVHIGGAGVARGYLNRPDLTQDKFIPNPFSHGQNARLYKTGDLARYLPDGNIEYLGRIDNQVKIRGFRIELGEIESLLSQHPAVAQVVVIALENAVGDKRLVAYLATVSAQTITNNELRDFLAQNLPDYMIPGAFVMLETLPLTPNGKVDRRALPEPDYSRQDSEETFIAPRNELELQLTQIWEKILGVKPIGVQDNFFALGGHSLLAVRLFSEIEKTMGKNLPLSTLFQKQTVEELATLIGEEETSPGWEYLVVIQEGKPTKPPLFCVHAVGGNVLFYKSLGHYLPPDQPFYALQAQGLDGKKPPLTSIPEMASNYIKEIQIIQPQGPYYLGGYSFGGPLILEVAQQLQAQGQEIRMLAVFDTDAPTIVQLNTERKGLIEKTFGHLQTFLSLDIQEKVIYIWERIDFHLTLGKMSILYQLYLRYIKQSLLDLRILDITKANNQARKNYVTQIYLGNISLFLSGEHKASELAVEPFLGWDKIATGEIDLYNIPNANHLNLVEEPNVRLLAEKLILCLEINQALTFYNSGSIQ